MHFQAQEAEVGRHGALRVQKAGLSWGPMAATRCRHRGVGVGGGGSVHAPALCRALDGAHLSPVPTPPGPRRTASQQWPCMQPHAMGKALCTKTAKRKAAAGWHPLPGPYQ